MWIKYLKLRSDICEIYKKPIYCLKQFNEKIWALHTRKHLENC